MEAKTLIFDIETSLMHFTGFRCGKQYVSPHQITKHSRIICICYKWHGEKEVHSLQWDESQCDKQMLLDFVKIANKADQLIAHNGDNFDIKWVRGRCLLHNIDMFPTYATLDTLKKSRTAFKLPSNKLDEIGRYLGIGHKIKTSYDLWRNVGDGDPKALEKMVKYCKQDVNLLEKVYNKFIPYITHNHHLGVKHGTEKYCCPNCGSVKVKQKQRYVTRTGQVKVYMRCKCKTQYTITNKVYQDLVLDRLNGKHKGLE